jgi:hypothetical protein
VRTAEPPVLLGAIGEGGAGRGYDGYAEDGYGEDGQEYEKEYA